MTRQLGTSRRDFLRLGLVAGPASLVAACGWDGGAFLEPRLRAFSRLNDWVGEKLLLSESRLAREYPIGERTAEQRFPAYSISWSRRRVYPAPPAGWQLEVGGLVRMPQRLTLEMLEALPRVSYTVKHHCVEGWTAIGTWTGVPVSALAELARPLPEARYLRFDSFDSGYSNGWDLASAMHPQTIVAHQLNGAPLPERNGAPLRMRIERQLGYKHAKYLTAIEAVASLEGIEGGGGGYWEDRGYQWYAGV